MFAEQSLNVVPLHMSLTCAHPTLYLDASEYLSVEPLNKVAMSLVWRLVSAGVNGRLGTLEVMRSVDTITGRMLSRRGDVLRPGTS